MATPDSSDSELPPDLPASDLMVKFGMKLQLKRLRDARDGENREHKRVKKSSIMPSKPTSQAKVTSSTPKSSLTAVSSQIRSYAGSSRQKPIDLTADEEDTEPEKLSEDKDTDSTKPSMIIAEMEVGGEGIQFESGRDIISGNSSTPVKDDCQVLGLDTEDRGSEECRESDEPEEADEISEDGDVIESCEHDVVDRAMAQEEAVSEPGTDAVGCEGVNIADHVEPPPPCQQCNPEGPFASAHGEHCENRVPRTDKHDEHKEPEGHGGLYKEEEEGGSRVLPDVGIGEAGENEGGETYDERQFREYAACIGMGRVYSVDREEKEEFSLDEFDMKG